MKKIITLLLASIMLLSVTGCNKNPEENKETHGTAKVWSTYSTAKVMIDKTLNDNYIDLGQKLDVSLAKGEKEMSQIIITADSDVNSYDIHISDLKSGENVFSKENIEVFNQKPIEIKVKSTGNHNDKFPKGWTPDCLLPFETAKKFGENKIDAGKNQPISFEFNAKADQPSGLYTGNFKVVVDGKDYDVPVSVNVWNYTLPAGMTGDSCMLIYQNELFFGELDSSDEMYTAYFEELLKNKLNAWHVPYTATSPEKMVDSVIKYWDYENFNSFGMPDLTKNDDVDYAKQKEYLLELGRRSTEDRILFDKAYFYHTVIDEPHTNAAKKDKTPSIIANVNKLFDDVIAQLATEGIFTGKPDYKEAMTKSIHSMPQIVTSSYFSEFDDSNLTYCPPIQFTNTVEQRTNLKSHADKHNVDTWAYTCNNPVYPFPSTHIDDYLIGSRIMRWMQKAYDIKGYLAWSVNTYSKIIPFDPLHRHEEINPYIDPQRVQGPGVVANGDGYLFYPGKKYKSDVPFTSIRMKSLRDGQDDYDALSLLQTKYNELSSYYNTDEVIDVNEIMSSVYDTLFGGVIYNSSDVIFDTARKTVANLIENTALNEKFVYSSEIVGDKLVVTMYLNNGYNLKVNDEELTGTPSGNGNKFIKEIPLSDFTGNIKMTVSKGDYTKDYNLTRNKVYSATNFADGSTELFTPTKSNTLEVTGAKLNATINSVDKGSDAANIRAFTGFTIKAEAFNNQLSNIDRIYFDIENTTSTDANFIIYVMAEGMRQEVMQVKLKGNSTVTVSIDRLYDMGLSSLDKADGILFAFENALRKDGVVSLVGERKLSISDIYYTKK